MFYLPSFVSFIIFFLHSFHLVNLSQFTSFLHSSILLLADIGNDYYEKKGAAGSYIVGFSGSSVTAGHGTCVRAVLHCTLLNYILFHYILFYSTLLYSNIFIPLSFFYSTLFSSILTYFQTIISLKRIRKYFISH